MKTRSVQIMTIIVSIFASFIVGLCVSIVDIAPLLIFVTLTAASSFLCEGHVSRPFTAIKLYTQKAE